MSKELKEKFEKANIEVAEVGAEIVTLKDKNVINIHILSCKDSIATINNKKRKQYVMEVIDLDDQYDFNGKPKTKGFNASASRLRKVLSDLNVNEGLINQKVRIEGIGQGTGRHFKLTKIN